jgi:hypothetical protein
LLDESGSKMNLTIQLVDPKTIDKKLAEAEQQKQQASAEEDFEKAAYYTSWIVRFIFEPDSSNKSIALSGKKRS